MKVLVLYNEPAPDATLEELDVLTQRDAVLAALRLLGHEANSFGCSLNLKELQGFLNVNRPHVVFNLVEALAGTDRLMAAPLLLLDAMDIPSTGAQARTILETSDKLCAKRKLLAAGLPTPRWIETSQHLEDEGHSADSQWIIKPVGEHASVGMDDTSVVHSHNPADIQKLCQHRSQEQGRVLFAEQYIDGREFNLSLLAGAVLPPAEIDFSAFPSGKPKIVGHKAKWDQDSFEYQQTPRQFEFLRGDAPLIQHLSQLAHSCWKLFELRGYARVDFRVDRDGHAWILEVNVNPCLSPDAGFAAALERASISFSDAVERILNDVFHGSSQVSSGQHS